MHHVRKDGTVDDGKKAKLRRFARGMVPVALAWLTQAACFLVPRLLDIDWYVPADVAAVDASIPFLPIFVFFYLGAFVQWLVCYLRLAQEDSEITYRLCAAHILSLVVCIACFFALPLAIERPSVEGAGLLMFLMRMVYRFDPPNRIFPSLHCLVSYFCTRRALALDSVSTAGKVWSVVFTFGVCLSTFFIKQHYVLDAVAGVVLAELAIQVAKRTGFENAFRRFCKRIQDKLFPL